MHKKPSTTHQPAERGAAIVELALILVPLMALMFAIIDFSLPIFLKSMFTAAVREGCRFGIAYQMSYKGTTYSSQTASIKAVVQDYSMGFLSGTSGANKISVNYYSPISPFNLLTGNGANNSGNILEVTINGYSWVPLAPIWRSNTALTINAISADRLEGLPAGASPPTP
jgi:Flp pilus assembly protein TadG